MVSPRGESIAWENSMTKKIIGLSCGRKNSNCEHFLKAALMAAEEEGVESEIVRLTDMKLTPCNSCQACFKTGKCAQDEADWVLEKTMLADGGSSWRLPSITSGPAAT
jgi:multimeric flavodoxin WrbA